MTEYHECKEQKEISDAWLEIEKREGKWIIIADLCNFGEIKYCPYCGKKL